MKTSRRSLFAWAAAALASIPASRLLRALPATAEGVREVYVCGKSGSDAGNGSARAPFRTFQRALDFANPNTGAHIIVNNTILRGETVRCGGVTLGENSGAIGCEFYPPKPIVFQGYESRPG